MLEKISNAVKGRKSRKAPKAPVERPTAEDLANKAERDAAYEAEQAAADLVGSVGPTDSPMQANPTVAPPDDQQSGKPDTSERARQLTMGQTPKE